MLTDIPFTDANDAQRGETSRIVRSSRRPPRTSTPTGRASSPTTGRSSTSRRIDPNQALPVCDGQKLSRAQAVNGIAYCGATGTIAYDHRLLPSVYERSGDFGVAWSPSPPSGPWPCNSSKASRAIRRPRSSSRAASPAPGRATSCAAATIPTALLTLSAGDLDEAIQSFLIFRDTDKISAGTGATAFENVDAFRQGFFEGEPSCVALVPES